MLYLVTTICPIGCPCGKWPPGPGAAGAGLKLAGGLGGRGGPRLWRVLKYERSGVVYHTGKPRTGQQVTVKIKIRKIGKGMCFKLKTRFPFPLLKMQNCDLRVIKKAKNQKRREKRN